MILYYKDNFLSNGCLYSLLVNASHLELSVTELGGYQARLRHLMRDCKHNFINSSEYQAIDPFV